MYSDQKLKNTCTLFKDLMYYIPYKIIRWAYFYAPVSTNFYEHCAVLVEFKSPT